MTKKKLKVGLFGFGKTGKAVAAVLLQTKEISLEWVVKSSRQLKQRSAAELMDIPSGDPAMIYSLAEFQSKDLLQTREVDVIIDFSSEEGIRCYGASAIATETAIVSAVSHYEADKISYLKKIASKTAVLWSPNITLGINFLMIASRILKNIAPDTDIEIIEEHFKQKRELSGTAKKLANVLDIPYDAIKMIRAGGIIGKHETLFGFPYQTIRLTHESISREAFGNGALFAAQNIHYKKAGLYSMEDLLMPYFSAKAR